MAHYRVMRFNLKGNLLLTLAAICAVSSQALALTIISPTEGSQVRERVKIVVPRSSVPSDGFVAVNIDGKFRAAAAMPEEESGKSSNSPYYTYIWDTKAPVMVPNSTAEPTYLSDGKHDVEVQIHDALGRRVESAKVAVHIKNKVARPSNAPAIKLYYRYRIGDQIVYHCKVDGEILDPLGQPLLSGVSAVKGEFDIVQSIEDVRPNGNALVRYKIGKDPMMLLYGKQVDVPGANSGATSVYKEIDRFGRVLRNNIVRKTSNIISDIMIRLPMKPVQVGESWPSEFKMQVMGDLVPFQFTNTLDSIEWEAGRECAKIQTQMTSLSKINIIPGDTTSEAQSPAKGTGTFFFAYNTGKLLKASAVIDADMALDPNVLSNLQQSTSGGGEAYGSAYEPAPAEEMSDGTEGYDTGSGHVKPQKKKRAPTVQVYGPSGMTNTQQVEKTTVRVRLNWTLEIKK